jgi:hypothetical protein
MIKSKEEKSKIEIDLTGEQGNSFFLLGMVKNLGTQIGLDKEKISNIQQKMMSGDYENLVQIFDKEFGDYVILYR